MVMPIVQIGHPVLREVATAVAPADINHPTVQTVIDELIDTRKHANGAGIAANQIDSTLRIFVVEVGSNPRYPYKPQYPLTTVVNPMLTFLTDERFNNYEGCLSIPDLRGAVPRCPHVRVQALDRHGAELDFEVRGISAGTFQHELDHLDGILFPDRIEDPHTLCTWDEFKSRYEDPFRQTVEQVEAKWCR